MQIRKWMLSAAAGAALFAAPAPLYASPGHESGVQVAQYGQYRRHQAKPTIEGMAFLNRKTTFYTGETVQVVLAGTPGGQAYFSIGGVQNDVPMTEVSSGRYQASFTVQDGMQVLNAPLRGRLVVNGRQTTYLDAARVTIGYAPGSAYTPGTTYPPYSGYNTNPYASSAPYGQMFVNVASPQAGQPVPRDFVVTGQTVPGAQVNVSARTQRQLIPGIINLGSQTATASGVADPNGYFSIPVHLGSSGAVIGSTSGSVDLKVVATDPRTSQSRQVEYNIATGY